MPHNILILGGTLEARDIAARLLAEGHDVTSSLAGVTAHPVLPPGKVRVGGFGGVQGLQRYLTENSVDVVLDATHPFAAQISNNAFSAVQNLPICLVRFERAGWQPHDGDTWKFATSLHHAAQLLPRDAKVFLTTGRKELDGFFARGDVSGAVRTVEPPSQSLPPHWHLILDRPPHTVQAELQLFRHHGFTHLVSKNAGGNATVAKLEAARILNLTVIMVQRPFKPPCETFSDVEVLTMRLGTSGHNG
jgi:precorrin-6A/cobalt-precorrin-6A reductase